MITFDKWTEAKREKRGGGHGRAATRAPSPRPHPPLPLLYGLGGPIRPIVGAGVVLGGVGTLVVARRALLYTINTFNHPPRATQGSHSASTPLPPLRDS